jgi:long-chain acyl-CoA synthetase
MKLTQTLNAAVQLRRNHVATVHGERRRTWGQIAERVARVAGGLAQLGVQGGDRIAILALNSDRYIESFFAIAWVGAVIVPLNTRWAVAENEYALNDSGPKILLVDENFVGQIPELSRRFNLEAIIYIGEGSLPDGMIAYETLAEAAECIEDRSGSYDDLLGIFYTGGTTGFPKGVMLSHGNVVYESVVWIYSLNFSEDTVYLHSAALFHLAGA